MAVLLLSAWWLSQHTRLRTDLSLFLPEGETDRQQLLLSELQQGYATRILLLAISGGDAKSRASLSQALLGSLRESGLFSRVENGTPGDLEIDSTLFTYRYLLSPESYGADAFSTEHLSHSLQQRLQELTTPIPNPFKSLLPRDPTGAYPSMLKRWQGQTQVNRSEGVWSSQQGEMAILLAETRESGFAIDQNQAMMQRLTTTFEELDSKDRHQLIVTGPAAFSVHSKQIIESESRLLSIIASLAIALLLYLAYAYLPYLLYAALPLFSGVLAATLVTGRVFTELHGITLAFGITLLGVALDYPVHLFSHIREGDKPSESMRRIWQTLRLGVVTTCLGYLVLVASSFEGLKQLGVFTLVGLLTAALTSRYLLPCLYADNFNRPKLKGERLISRLAQRSRRLPIAVTLIALLIVIAAILSPRPLWNDDIAVLSPLPSSLIAQDRSLRQALQADEASQMIVLEGDSIEQLLQRCESLRPYIGKAIDKGWLNGASLLCDALPSQKRQREIQSQLPEQNDLAIALQAALSNLPFKQEAFAPFIDEIAASRELPPLDYEMARTTLLGDRLAPYIKQTSDGWIGLVPLQFVLDNDALAEQFQDLLTGVSYLNLRSETSSLIEDFRATALVHLLLGACLMFLILWLGLRSFSHTLLVMLPIALAIAVTVSLLKLIGEEMNLFHLISLMLVLGIGIDYSLFFSRENEDLSERKATLHALGLCALSTVSVFTILATSRIPVLHAIGITVSIGVVSSFLLTYALAPFQAREHAVTPS